MNVVLNELSLSSIDEITCSVQEARTIINQFVDTLHSLLSSTKIKRLIAIADIHSFFVTTDYGIQEWFKDQNVEKKKKDFLRSMLGNRCEYIYKENYALSEFVINVGEHQLRGTGCLVAFDTNGKTISLPTHPLWREYTISGICNTLDPDTEDTISTEAQLINISNADHVSLLQIKIIEHTFQQISSGQDLWEYKEFLFPNLEFCNSVREQLIEDSQKFHISQVLIKLQRMNEYFGDDDTDYNPHKLGFNARTESETVQQNPELKQLRKFRTPNGESRYFFDHIGFTGNYCGRIHFIPDKANKKCCIGYIGKHLKTARY